MCGRYYINDETAKEIEKLIRQIDDALLASCKERDVYPSAKAPVILAGSEQSDQLTAGEFTWGFPSYSNKGVIFNARSETALEKKTFRESVKQRRCIIPATGFYEWSEQKDKYFFRAPDRHVLLFAGFYRHYEDGDRFVILTTQANPSTSSVHPRMPLILSPQEVQTWLFDDNAAASPPKSLPRSLFPSGGRKSPSTPSRITSSGSPLGSIGAAPSQAVRLQRCRSQIHRTEFLHRAFFQNDLHGFCQRCV